MEPVTQAVSLFGASFGYASSTAPGAAIGALSGQGTLQDGVQGLVQSPVQGPAAGSEVASAAAANVSPTADAPHAPFADLLVDAVGEVEKAENQARTAVEGLMTGRGVDVHQAMIATGKAEAGFELVLAVRNKALAAYQQVMGMQF